MAQVDYFMTDAETSRLLEDLVARYAVRFTPQRHDTSEFPVFTRVEELAAREQAGHFRTRYFVTSSQWGLHPFKVEEFKHPVHGHFSLGLREGGPFFDHLPSRFYVEDSKRWIVPGMFSDHPTYYPSRGDWREIPRPPEMAKAFGEIRRLILKKAVRSRCIERGFTGPHISPGALEFFKNGGWLRVGDWHFEPLEKAG
jgi:hypothetical protein